MQRHKIEYKHHRAQIEELRRQRLKIKKADKAGRKEAANEIKALVKLFEERQRRELDEFDAKAKQQQAEESEKTALQAKIQSFKFDLPMAD